MPSKELKNNNITDTTNAKPTSMNPVASTHVVAADSVQAEEVPTIPLGSLQTINSLQPEVSVHSVASTRTVGVPVPLVVQPSEYRRSLGEWFQVWWDSIRPAYLSLSLIPLIVGSILAWTQTISAKTPLGHFHTNHFIGMLLAIVLLQIGAHLVNDYYDYVHGVDTSNTLGPGGLIQQGLISPTRVLTFGLTALGLGAAIGIVVALAGGPLVYLLGLIGLLCAYFYSATSRSLSSLALGEVVSFFIFGPFITLGAYLVMIQTGHIDRSVFVYSIPLGLLAMAAIHANNMRDIEGDAHAGRSTLASILGMRWSRFLFITLLLVAYLIIAALAIPRGAPHILLLIWWTLPILAVVITGVARSATPVGLHLVMRQTLKLETYFALLLVVALAVSALLSVLPHLPTHLLPF